MKRNHPSEQGQILILLVLVIIGLLGFTALAIDGGMIFADRRYTQSAADAASLAGAGAAADIVQANEIGPVSWNCSSSALKASVNAAIDAAISSAALNDFVIAFDKDLGTPGHDHGVRATCDNAGRHIDVEVMLSRITHTSFAHLFTNGVMRNTVYSQTEAEPMVKAGNGASIVGMGKECDKNDKVNGGGVHFDSSSLVTILTGGGVYSNDCVMNKNNSDVTVEGGGVTCHEGTACETQDMTLKGGAKVSIDPGFHPMTGVELFDVAQIEAKCAAMANHGDSDGGDGEIGPGRYRNWDFKDPVTLKPGLYCVSGTVKMTAGGDIQGTDVTIYYTGTDLTINGHENSELTAPNYNGAQDPPNGAIEDVLLYVPMSVKADIKINGNSNNTISGTLWAPESYFQITGTSDMGNPTNLGASVIGKTVWVSGTSYINLHYQEDMDAGWPASIQLEK